MKELYEKLKVVDIDGDELIELYAMEGDTARVVNFKFKNGVNIIDLTNCKVRINAINSKYNVIFNDLTIVDSKRGIAQLKLTTALLTPGVTEYQLEITGQQGELKPKIMRLNVAPKLNNDGAIEGSNEFGVLKNTMNEIDELIRTGTETNESLASNIKTGTNLKTGLDSSINSAKTSERSLDSSINIGNTLKENLTNLNSTAQNTKEELNAAITKGDIQALINRVAELERLNATRVVGGDSNKGYEEYELPNGKIWVHEFGWYNTVSGGGVKMSRIEEIISCSATPSSTVQGTCTAYTDGKDVLRFAHNFSGTIYIYWHAWGYK